MELWIVFIVLYGIFKGLREPIKKKTLEKCDMLSCLFMYTFIGFLMSIPLTTGSLIISPYMFVMVAVKSFIIFLAWMAAFVSVRKLPVSLYGVVDMSRVIFSTVFGVVLLGEPLTVRGMISLLLVVGGLYLVNLKKTGMKEDYNIKYVWITIGGCALNAVSAIFDKYLMSTGEITSSQLQFWFMLMLSAFYLAYILISGKKVDVKGCIRHPGIYILSFLLVMGDKLLFIANANPASKVTVMTLIKQSAVIVTIAAGKIVYKEKNIAYKVICAIIIIVGILISVAN
ncbi:MAG: EamA family transporter [Clostridia bacterium]|nr:EamA family transporter [Clostridia bacterium]